MSSQMGHVGAANRTIYCASKWGLEGFTKVLAMDLAPHRIRVNTICPTFVETPMTEPFFRDPASRSEVLAKIPLGRIGRVDDVAAAAVFLASDAASLMTGSALMLDGGGRRCERGDARHSCDSLGPAGFRVEPPKAARPALSRRRGLRALTL
ncbi:SDR family NAD(P)-dependent oxidoreductase [Ancylobacter sp.]|uniref:SDR family NAD(P)-dependent oxidoreductase n=1 Tax=Ancylobacter sp. TaxID=1872567 RepID=UPI003BA984F2